VAYSKRESKKNIADVFVKKQLCGRGSLVSAGSFVTICREKIFLSFCV